MTLNKLIKLLSDVQRQLSSGNIPITINGMSIDVVEITFENIGKDNWCNIAIKEVKNENQN